MVSGTISMWTLRVGLGILMGRYWGLGVLGVWIAMCIDWLLRVTLFVVRFKGHKWETMGIKD
jgi:Na+-driven multidrug efflux pump